MGKFSSSKVFAAPQEFIPFASRKIRSSFESEGFEYSVESESANRMVVTVTKGNLFKQIVGLKQGLEITLSNNGGKVSVSAKGTVFKDQLIASALTWWVAWPVIIPQVIGMINQSNLDEKVIDVVSSAYQEFDAGKTAFCPFCGTKVSKGDTCCPHCGASLNN